ncbi:BON domain-containing protein [Micromonospora sp. WMMD987]|jgi:osmotically-inducible protein OsmY|uniref:BON domain-containing protein n=1 Tax=Micromonospora sp. WMMD987 TaxID=3016089 RepID=UPI00249BFE48|nr:BON domain-containing protein [Micromonospora sp. WMMD987]WFE97848.1 BON domain-containing protein [Micromonospora sp. WMMD987]
MVMPWPLPDESWFRPEPGPPGPPGDDVRLAAEVAYRIVGGVGARARRITVTVQNRVAILGGLVPDAATRRFAGQVAWQVPGVVDVCNTLRLSSRR